MGSLRATIMPVLPQAPTNPAQLVDWAARITSAISQQIRAQSQSGTATFYDTSKRVILTEEGIYAYDAQGGIPISPDIVQINTQHLVDAAVDTAKLANLAVDHTKLASLAVQAANIADGAVGTTQVANGAITSGLLANAAVVTAAIANSAVGTTQIANAAITSALLGSAAVGTAQIANGAITSALIGSAAVGSAAIANAAVGTAEIANAAITSALIGDGQIVNAKIADLAVNGAKIANASIGSAHIQNLAVQTAHVQDAAITSAKINSITANQITAGTIGAQQIYLGDPTFLLDGGAQKLTIADKQATPIKRIELGYIGTTVSDYGLILRDASGAVFLDSGGVQKVASGVIQGSIPNSQITGLGIFATAAQLTASTISTYIAGAAIGNALIGSAAIKNANIDTAAVDTLQLAGQAVTIPLGTYASAKLTFSTSSAFSEIIKNSVGFASTGAPINIMVNSVLSVNGSLQIDVRLERLNSDGSLNTVLWEADHVVGQPGSPGLGVTTPAGFSYVDQPGAGTWYYRLSGRENGSSSNTNSWFCMNRYMLLIETKR